MSTSQAGPSKSSNLSVGLSNFNDVLTVLANVADGGINVPFVKASAQIAIQVINAAQQMKNNKDDCLTVARMASNLMCALVDPLCGKREEDINEDLKNMIVEFGNNLQGICVAMKDKASRTRFQRFLTRTTDLSDIRAWKEYLNHTCSVFLIKGYVAGQIAQTAGFNKISQSGSQNAAQDIAADDKVFLSRTPPPKPSVFHGRDDFLADAVKLILAPEPTRLAILGTGGMGKTSLALSILHHPQVKDHFGDQEYFVPCDSAISPQQLMTCILTVLQVPKVEKEDVYTSLHDFLTRSSALLLVLDNFETSYYTDGNQTAISELLKRIASIDKVALVVTMRGHMAPDGVQWTETPMSPLSLQASKEIFFHINPNVPESSELDILLKEVDYMPLAVTLLSNLAKSKSNTCKNLLKQWGKVKTRLLRTELGKGGRLTNAEVSIEMSLKFGPVAQVDEAIPLLALISYLPNGVYKWSDRLDQIAPSFQCLDDALEALTRAGLVQDQNDCLKVLSPIRHYVLNEHPLSDQHLKALEKYYIGVISQYAYAKYSKINDLLNVEAGNIISVIKTGCHHKIYNELAKAAFDMSWYLYWNSPTTELLDLIISKLEMVDIEQSEADCLYLGGLIFEAQSNYKDAEYRLREAESQFKEIGNHIGAAQCLRSLGHVLYMQNEYTEAQTKLQQALDLFTKIWHRLGAAQCLQSLGDVLCMQNEYTEAQTKLQQALDLFTEIGDRLGAAQCLWSLGNVLRMQHEYTEAQTKLQQALDLFTEIGDRLGAAQCLQSLGDVLRMQNEYTEAQTKLQQALDLFTEIGDRPGAPQCLQSLGDVLRMQNEYTEAQTKLQQALNLFTEIGDRLGAAQCLQILGNVLRMQNEYTEAQTKLQQALDVFTEIGGRLGAAQCLWGLGDVLRMQNECTEAQTKLQQALDLFTEIGDRLGAARCLRSLGDVLCMQNEYTEAQTKLQQALDLFTEIGDHFGAAQCLQSLGDVLRMQNECTEAQTKLQQALDLFTEIGHRLGAAQCLQSLGNVLHMQNEYAEAQTKLQQALDLFTEIGNHIGAAQCLQHLGDIFCAQDVV